MTEGHRLSRALVRLYPRRWRERYAPEFLALLESMPDSAGTTFDVFRGGLAEWRHEVADRVVRWTRSHGRTALFAKRAVLLTFLLAVGFPALLLANATCSILATELIRTGWVLPSALGSWGSLGFFAFMTLTFHDRYRVGVVPRSALLAGLVLTGALLKWDQAVHRHLLLFSSDDLCAFIPGSLIGTLALGLLFRPGGLPTRPDPAPPKSDLTVLNLSGALDAVK